MIICPNCKEEIEDRSHYCDQCGQRLLYCERCERVGMGRRCTHCGGLMLLPEDLEKKQSTQGAMAFSVRPPLSVSVSTTGVSQRSTSAFQQNRLPELVLSNDAMNIRMVGIDGAIIGRRQGPYVHFFEQDMFVSGMHAQLKYNSSSGWMIVDKHSSNGTKLNDRRLEPDVEMSLKHGDVLTIANINLNVSII